MTSDEVTAVIAKAIEQSGNNVLVDDLAVGVLAALAAAGLVLGTKPTEDVAFDADVPLAEYGLALVRVVPHG